MRSYVADLSGNIEIPHDAVESHNRVPEPVGEILDFCRVRKPGVQPSSALESRCLQVVMSAEFLKDVPQLTAHLSDLRGRPSGGLRTALYCALDAR
jgi:hypothetical protein